MFFLSYIYRPIPRDYSQTTANWNPQLTNYKTNPKATMLPTGTYQQHPSYQLPQQQQQQQLFLGAYQYPTLSPTVNLSNKISIIQTTFSF